MNYDLYQELKTIADRPTSKDMGGSERDYDDGQIDLARKVLNAYAKDNGNKSVPYPEV